MASFLTPEQKELVRGIAALLTQREQTVCVAEATTGGLLSAALLSVAGASRYYRGGGVLYTQKSRVALAGVSADAATTSPGSTAVDMLTITAAAMRERLEATWCIAETGTAGPTGGRSGTPPGHTSIAIVGPVNRREVFETGLDDREANMVEFATRSLRLFHETLQQ